MASASSQQNSPLFRDKNHESKAGPRANVDIYRRKYSLLKRKCESIQLDNEKCLNRLYYVKKAVRKMSRERRFLLTKLNKHGDDCKNATLPLPIEDDSMLHLMSINTPITPSFPASRGLAGLVSKSQQSKTPARRSRVGRPRLISEMTSRDDEPQPVGRGSKRKRMASQNPLAPKKPANAFLMFCQTKRQTLQAESAAKNSEGVGGPDMTHQEMTRQLAKRWKFLGPGEKEAYYTMYERDKDRYHKEMKEYIKSNNLDTMMSFTTPQPPTDAVAKKEPILSDQTISRKREPSAKGELRLATDPGCLSTTSGPSISTTSAAIAATTNTAVIKTEPSGQAKADVKTTSLTSDSGAPKLKRTLHLNITNDGDDPYHFDDD